MKVTTRCTLLLLILIGFNSCSDSQEIESKTNSFLTSSKWKSDDQGIWLFNPDGTYKESYDIGTKGDNLQLMGTWKWINDKELSFLATEIRINGKVSKLDKKAEDCTIFSVKEISSENLNVEVRNNSVGEAFGFTNAKSFTASEL